MATMRCPRCGSEKIMRSLRIRDLSEAGVGQDLEVEGGTRLSATHQSQSAGVGKTWKLKWRVTLMH